MSAYGNAGLCQTFYQRYYLGAALQLNCGAACFLQEACSIIHCINNACLIAHKRHIANY